MIKLRILFILLCLLGVSHTFSQGREDAKVFESSYALEEKQNYTDAIAILKNLDLNDYAVNLRLGWLYYLAGDCQQSSIYYGKAFSIQPKAIEALLGSTYCLSAMGNTTQLLVQYEKVLDLDSKNYTGNYYLASIYFEQKKFSKSLSYAKTIHELYPFDYDVNYLLGQIYLSLGKLGDAKFHYYEALKYYPSNKQLKELIDSL